MEVADELVFDADPPEPPRSTGGHGGRREGAGRKPKGYQPPQEKVDFESARARNEAAKAALNELELERQAGRVVERAAVRQAAATLLATVTQALRSIPDNLERRGAPTDVAETVQTVIDEALDALADGLQFMAGDE